MIIANILKNDKIIFLLIRLGVWAYMIYYILYLVVLCYIKYIKHEPLLNHVNDTIFASMTISALFALIIIIFLR